MLIILNKTSDKIFCKAFKQSDHPLVNPTETIFVGQHEIRFLQTTKQSGARLFQGVIFRQIPDPARASPGAKSATDTERVVHYIFIAIGQTLVLPPADGGLGANGNTDATVPADTA